MPVDSRSPPLSRWPFYRRPLIVRDRSRPPDKATPRAPLAGAIVGAGTTSLIAIWGSALVTRERGGRFE